MELLPLYLEQKWQEITVATASLKGVCFSVLFTLQVYMYMVGMTGRCGDKSKGWDIETFLQIVVIGIHPVSFSLGAGDLSRV
jgi:hypothetical protein